jgi:hypothetical protein
MVSPPYKAGYGVELNLPALGAAPNGESFVFQSLGAFAGTRAIFVQARYVARRTPSGWVTSSTMPPPVDGRVPGIESDYSPNLCWQVTPVGGEDENMGTQALMLDDLCAQKVSEISFVQAWPLPDGPAMFPGDWLGASADLSHLFYQEFRGGIYQIVGVGGPEPKEEVVAVVGEPDGPGGSILQPCPGPGGRSNGEDVVNVALVLHPVSEDGSELFFSHCKVPYVRVNNAETFELSPAGVFLGASGDGSKAFFTNGAGELLMDVIDRERGHEAVSETVPVTPGAQASVVVTSDDGSHVYFTSSSVLAGANAQGPSPQTGASNLYVYNSLTRETAFIAVTELDGQSGQNDEAQTTPDGSFLVFTTHARLTSDDTDTAADVYRYDAQTGGLVRVSAGENGHDDNGNNNAFGANIAAPPIGPLGQHGAQALTTWRLGTRAVSDDGSTIVFSTAEPLSPRALNGKVNVYVWHEGRVGMISTGLSQTSDEYPVVSQSGRDIFFLTRQNILPQDSDGLLDIYDARIGGGFPEPSVPAGGCSGDTCQGPPSVPSLLGAPASATFSGLGNPVAPVSKAVVKPKVKPKPKCKRGYARNKKGKCVKVKRARKAATAPRRGHQSSKGARS